MLMNLINNGVVSVYDVIALNKLGYEIVIEDGKVTDVKKAVAA